MLKRTLSVITYLVRGRSACCQAQALEAAQADQQSAATEVAVVSGAWPASAASRCTARTNPQQELRTLQQLGSPGFADLADMANEAL